MGYKIRKSYGGKFGGAGIRSSYIKPRDHVSPYRHASHPETEYDRKLRNTISMSETRGPSKSSSDYHRYQINRQIKDSELGMSRKEVQDLITASLKDSFKKFIEVHNVEQVPLEAVESASDAAYAVVNRMQNRGQEAEPEQEPVDLSKLNEERQELVAEKWREVDQTTTLEEAEPKMAEIRDINSDFLQKMDGMETGATEMQNERAGTVEAINEINPLLDSTGIKPVDIVEEQEFVPAFDLAKDNFGTRRAKSIDYGYDSEVEGW